MHACLYYMLTKGNCALCHKHAMCNGLEIMAAPHMWSVQYSRRHKAGIIYLAEFSVKHPCLNVQ